MNFPRRFFVNGGSDWTLRTPIIVFPVQNNTNAATLQLTLGGKVLGTFPLYKGNQSELVANDIIKGIPLICLLDSEKSYFSVINPGNIYSDFDLRYVKKSGDLMTGELKIRGVNALRIFDDALGMIFRRSEDSFHLIPTVEGQGENGGIGPLRPFSINLRTGDISVSHKLTVGSGLLVHGDSIATGELLSGNGSARLAADGNLYGGMWGGWLSSYLQNKMGVQDIRLGSVGASPTASSQTTDVPGGCVMTGVTLDVWGSRGTHVTYMRYRPLQKLINGTWYNVTAL